MELKTGEQENILYIFTTSFPYGTGETFLQDELMVLKEHFRKIYIFPLIINNSQQYKLPENVETVKLFEGNPYNGKKTLFKNTILFLNVLLKEFFKEKNKKGFLKRIKFLRSNLLQCIHVSEILKNYLEHHKNGNPIFYSYWLHDWATILSLVKKKGKDISFSSRVHGYDLYLERHTYGVIPYRNFQLKNCDAIFTVSNDGKNYLNKNYPEFTDKFKLSHLGVFEKGTNPFLSGEKYFLVSCSNCNPVKRVHLIAEALKNCKSEIHWTHFGDGEEMKCVREAIGHHPANITSDLRGRVDNQEITEFYKNHPVHLFIHVSSTEGGVPVAIQEAISFGIPVLAVASGGVVDIVNENSGILIDSKNCSSEIISVEIEKMLHSKINSAEFRIKVKEEWRKEFSANKNYESFCLQLMKENGYVI